MAESPRPATAPWPRSKRPRNPKEPPSPSSPTAYMLHDIPCASGSGRIDFVARAPRAPQGPRTQSGGTLPPKAAYPEYSKEAPSHRFFLETTSTYRAGADQRAPPTPHVEVQYAPQRRVARPNSSPGVIRHSGKRLGGFSSPQKVKKSMHPAWPAKPPSHRIKEAAKAMYERENSWKVNASPISHQNREKAHQPKLAPRPSSGRMRYLTERPNDMVTSKIELLPHPAVARRRGAGFAPF